MYINREIKKAYIYMYDMYIYVYMFMHMYVYIYIYIHANNTMDMKINMCIYVCRVCIYIFTCIHVYNLFNFGHLIKKLAMIW